MTPGPTQVRTPDETPSLRPPGRRPVGPVPSPVSQDPGPGCPRPPRHVWRREPALVPRSVDDIGTSPLKPVVLRRSSVLTDRRPVFQTPVGSVTPDVGVRPTRHRTRTPRNTVSVGS